MSDIFSTHTLISVVAGLKKPSSFLLDMFFPLIQQADTEEFDFDVIDKTRRLAPFVSPMVGSQIIKEQGVETKRFKPAYIKPKQILDTNRPLKRVVGERIGGAMNPAQRIPLLVGRMVEEQVDMINRRKEVMAAEALCTGRVTVSGESYPTVVVDFGRDPSQTVVLTEGDRWGQVGVKPLADLEAWSLGTLRRSGAKPKNVVMDTEAWAVFQKDPDVASRLDTRHIVNAVMNTGGPDDTGGTYMGRIDGFELWVYADWYIDPVDNEEKPILPAGTVLMASSALEGTRAYGAIRDDEAGYQAMPYFPKSWSEPDPSVRYIMTQSAPLIVPTRPNASFAATVL